MSEQFEPHPPEQVWKLGPLGIKRTADFLALAAFILSLVGLIAQVSDHARGASVTVFETDLVTLGSSTAFGKKYPRGEAYVLLAATMSYVNDAPIGYNGTVRREYVRVFVGGQKFQLPWHDIVDTSTDPEGGLIVKKVGNSGPFPVNAGSSLSHEVLFEPSEFECPIDDSECVGSKSWLLWNQFLEVINREQTIRVSLLAEIYGKGTISAQCTLSLTKGQLQVLEEKGWVTLKCKGDKKNSVF